MTPPQYILKAFPEWDEAELGREVDQTGTYDASVSYSHAEFIAVKNFKLKTPPRSFWREPSWGRKFQPIVVNGLIHFKLKPLNT